MLKVLPQATGYLEFLPPAYVVRREGNVFTGIRDCAPVHRGVPTLTRGIYLGHGEVPTLAGGYLPWLGVPTLIGGYLLWMGDTYLGQGVPTLARAA